MDNNDSAYEDRNHGQSHRNHRHHRREEKRRQENDDDLHDGRDFDSRRSSRDEKHRDGERRRYSSGDPADNVERRRERSKSYDRGGADSAERERDERHRDRDRRHRSARDSVNDVEARRERSRSYERGARDSVERDRASREESVEKRSSKKRKDHGGRDEDASEKWSRHLDGAKEEKKEVKRERRRFEDRVDEETRYLNGNHEERRRDERQFKDKAEEVEDAGERRKERKFKDRVKGEQLNYSDEKREEQKPSDTVKEERMSDGEDGRVPCREERRGERKFKDSENVDKFGERRSKDKVRYEEVVYQEEMKLQVSATGMERKAVADKLDSKQKTLEKGTSRTTIGVEQQRIAGADVSTTTVASTHPQQSKVSMISTINENVGVSITRSDEVTGKFSADGAGTSLAGKSGSLSLDALAKAKKALQMQKELSEKLKKIPLLNKIHGSSTDISGPAELKSVTEAPSSVLGQGGSSASAVTASQPTTSTASVKPSSGSTAALPELTTVPNYEAVKRAQELAARMGFHHDPQFAPLINMFPGAVADVSIPQKPSKAPVLRLDAQGREIDEHGNVISMPKPTSLSTLKVNINKQKKEAFQILKPELDVDAESNPHFDATMGINKTKLLRPKRMAFQFVEEGKWSRQAEIIRFKSQFGEAQAKELKIKQAQLAKAKAEPDINPNLIEVSERVVKEKQKDPIPEIEWWDRPILLSGTYNDSSDEKLNMEKIDIYIEHPLPIEPPVEPAAPPPQPLKLTKKEQKKLRTQRRLAKERDRQEMIRQGLIEPPKPKIKMSNLMKVLGSEATQDPTRLEMEIRTAAAEREQAHVDRNIARKLTPAERREKKERKLFEDPYTLETIVSVYKVNHLTHPKNRFRVDVNAQENRLTGCAVISEGICVVVVEGGKKSNKRYKKLMLKRIDWAADVGDEDEKAEALETPVNRCLLVWQGSVAKPTFNRFLVHQCRTEAAARKVFADAGVEHYWDLAANFSDEVI